MRYFAHAGHEHESEATPSTPQQTETKPEPTTTASEPAAGNTTSPDLMIGSGLMLGLILFWILTTYIFKLKLATRLSIIMVAFLVVGMLGYQSAPVTSIIALSVGIALALGTVLTQLGTKTTDSSNA